MPGLARWCVLDSVFVPGTKWFSIVRWGGMDDIGLGEPRQRAMRAEMTVEARIRRAEAAPWGRIGHVGVLLDYRCHAPGGAIGRDFPPATRKCLQKFAKSTPDVFERDGLDVAVQQLSVGGRSIALIALADLTADRSEVLRLATDLGATGPRALLGVLSRDFVVSVAFFREGRTPHRCVQLRSGRESNVARILALPAQPEPDAVDIETAIARALAARSATDIASHERKHRHEGRRTRSRRRGCRRTPAC